jgi:hypothetical protein
MSDTPAFKSTIQQHPVHPKKLRQMVRTPKKNKPKPLAKTGRRHFVCVSPFCSKILLCGITPKPINEKTAPPTTKIRPTVTLTLKLVKISAIIGVKAPRSNRSWEQKQGQVELPRRHFASSQTWSHVYDVNRVSQIRTDWQQPNRKFRLSIIYPSENVFYVESTWAPGFSAIEVRRIFKRQFILSTFEKRPDRHITAGGASSQPTRMKSAK